MFSADISIGNCYPKFITGIKFSSFRHIKELTVDFRAPVTVVSGMNKCGKTTLLLAMACSHFDFVKRNYSTGVKERQTWSDVLKFTGHDKQITDWTYHLFIKSGDKNEVRRGQRKSITRKWNGVGKKETQIKDVSVVYSDLDRIVPARYASLALHRNALVAASKNVSSKNHAFIEQCLSYIFEENYQLQTLAVHGGKDLFGYSSQNSYSSYNSASGEDVILRILIDCIDAKNHSLILIDEIELGLHPSVQRRLMDIIFEISNRDQKQFIVTSHSATIISAVPETARVFIGIKSGNHYAVSPISLNAALTKMDSKNHPLIDLFCEDLTARKILEKVLELIEQLNLPGVSSKLINLIESGCADDTYMNFIVRTRTYDQVKIKSGHCCVLDGDMRSAKTKEKQLKFPPQDGLFFLPGSTSPEHVLCNLYEIQNNNSQLRYHIDDSNAHCLLQKMVEIESLPTSDSAFEACWKIAYQDLAFKNEIDQLVEFIVSTLRRYSPEL